ncbi:hypothetical protein Angca_009677 [Angiostrongylus cantonensis]|nr:hypothetical protein Angca_009677 [Angiostrongylus cantonensis]
MSRPSRRFPNFSSGSFPQNMMFLVVFQPLIAFVSGKPLNLLNAGSFRPVLPNYCNNSTIMSESGLIRANMGQFLGYECSSEFFQCRWESDGFRTYRKRCTAGLVYDVLGTQNCNYDYNVKTCGIKNGAKLFAGPLVSITFSGPASCNSTSFHCSQSEQCVPLSKRCDGHYDCLLEEDEQNCPMCLASEFACVVSEQCVQFSRRCNGISECNDGTDEKNCDVCGNGLFHCAKSDECIPKGLRCDGIRQCPHGEDELLCKRSTTNRRFTCLSLEEYIPMTQVCDGIPQCIDGSDELYCSMGTGNEQPPASSMFFSLDPIRKKRPRFSKHETDNKEFPPNQDKPLFPMFSITAPPNTSTTVTGPPRSQPLYRILSVAVTTASASSGSLSKVHSTGQATTNIVTNGTFQFSKTTARPSTMLSTSKAGRVTSLKPKPPAEVTDGKTKHYLIAPDDNGKERCLQTSKPFTFYPK